MHVAVLLKRTFDTEEKIRIVDGRISDSNVNYIINPYDEYAVEEAVRIKEQFGGEVTVYSVGSEEAEKELRTALAMGADKAILIKAPEGGDERTVSLLLAEALRKQSYDLILGGYMSVDTGAGQVAARVAELLDIPQVTAITKLTVESGKAVAERDAEGDVEIVEVSLPALFTAQQGLNEPRYPSLPGIMKAKKKPLEILEADALISGTSDLAAKTEMIEISAPPAKSAGKILQGDAGDQVKALVQLLRNEAKVI